MSQFPFQANSGTTTTGKTVIVTANNTPTSVSGTVDSTGGAAPTMLVTNSGTVLVFVRMSAEPSSSITATNADIPILAGASLILSNPVPYGKTGVAALSSTTTQAVVYFTPGNGSFK